MVKIDDFKGADGKIDWGAYRTASAAERKAEVAAGKWCYICGSYLLFAKGYRDQCHACRDLTEDAEEVTHDNRIRCPKCKHVESVSDGDNYDLYGDGEHEVTCGSCGREYEVSTSVSYSFRSPAIEGSGDDGEEG